MRQQIETIYKTFSPYPLKRTVNACPCCVNDTDQALIQSKPPRELNSHDLQKYTSKAITTWGDVDDFKHFLPRILELMVLDEYASDFALIIGKLQYADFKHWKEKEVAVVENS